MLGASAEALGASAIAVTALATRLSDSSKAWTRFDISSASRMMYRWRTLRTVPSTYMTTEERVERLPKGPHDLTRAQVETSQRQRILDAVLDVVGSHGYASATVAHITRSAGVSRTTFYEQFASKQVAFLAAYDEFGKQFL